MPSIRASCPRKLTWAILLVLLCILATPGCTSKTGKKAKKGSSKPGGGLKTKQLADEGLSLLDKRNFKEAAEKFSAAIKADPEYSDYHTQLATCYRAMGQVDRAIDEYKLSIAGMNETRNRAGGDQYWAAVHINLGYLYAEGGGQGRFPGAMQLAADMFRAATRLQPRMAEAYTYLGNAYQEMKQWKEAMGVFETAIATVTSKADTERLGYQHFHLANCLGQLGETDRSLAAYRDATRVKPDFAAAYTNLGTIYQGRKQNERAREALELAVKIDGTLAEAYTNLGIAVQDLGDQKRAVELTRIATELKPELSPAHNNYGRALENDDRLEDALVAYRTAIRIAGAEYGEAVCARVYLEHFLCEWEGLEEGMQQVAHHLARNLAPSERAVEPCVQPFRAFAYPLDPYLFTNVTIKIVNMDRDRLGPNSKFQLTAERALNPQTRRLRVGYMSSDFGGHTVGSLVRNLLKVHNRNRVEVCGIGLMKGDGTEWNVDMQASVDKWLSIHGMTDHAAAFAVDSLEVHVLIDLNGHSKGARVGVLLRRPAPILASFLGYPSTSGGLDDVIIADMWTLPPETRDLYTEKMVYMPQSYFVNDHRQLYPRPFDGAGGAGGAAAARGAHGLPAGRTLMGNFGQLYKVDPRLFDAWCRVARRLPAAALWLLEFPAEAAPRLRAQARRRGLPAGQLVLTPLLAIDDHLAIKSLADFALDSGLFNGHTTGADTLWAGLPMVTLPGVQMRSRAGASMALALGESAALARTLEDYEDIAVRLGSSRRGLDRVRARLAKRIDDSGFFDTLGWAKGFERAWFLMWDAFQASGDPQSHHLRAISDGLDKYGLDWEPSELMIGTSRRKRRGPAAAAAAAAAAAQGGGEGPAHDPLKIRRKS